MFKHVSKQLVLFTTLYMACTSTILAQDFYRELENALYVAEQNNPEKQELFQWLTLLRNRETLYAKDAIVSFSTAEKLDLLNGVRTLFPTATVMGSINTAEQLLLAHHGQHNQAIIRIFAENPELLARAQAALEKIKTGTAAYLSYAHGTQSMPVKDAYFSSDLFKVLNKNVYALTALHAVKNSLKLADCLPAETFSAALFNYLDAYLNSGNLSAAEKARLYGIDTPVNILHDTVKIQIAKHSLAKSNINLAGDVSQLFNSLTAPKDFLKSYFKLAKNSLYATMGDSIQFYNAVLPYSASVALAGTNQAFADFMNAHRIYRTIKGLKEEGVSFQQLQTKLIAVATLVRGLTELEDVATQADNGELNTLVLALRAFLYQENSGTELGTLLSMLKTSTFEHTAYWSNRPRILVANALLVDNAQAFIAALEVAGHIDALQAAAVVYQQHAHTQTPYSFVQFTESALPDLTLVDFWHPLLKAEQAVLNTMILGANGSPNALILGANGTGKSVTMSGMMLNVIIGQALGITAADYMTVTPFTHINVYRNEQEDLDANLSTFMAEAKKLDEICNQIATLEPGQRSLVIMDEMLKGTVDPRAHIYEIGLKLAQHKRSVVVMVTHCDVTNLEADTAGAFVNYHLEVAEPTLGNFVRTFKLVQGAPTWWFTDVTKRDAFINHLTQRSK